MLTDENIGGIVLRQIEIPQGSPIEGRTIGHLAGVDMRVSVLALKRGDEELQAMPSPEMILNGGRLARLANWSRATASDRRTR